MSSGVRTGADILDPPTPRLLPPEVLPGTGEEVQVAEPGHGAVLRDHGPGEPGPPVSVDHVNKLSVSPVEPSTGGDIQPVEGVGNVHSEERAGRVETRDPGQPGGGDGMESGSSEPTDVSPQAVANTVNVELMVQPVGQGPQAGLQRVQQSGQADSHVPGVGCSLVVIERVCREGEVIFS